MGVRVCMYKSRQMLSSWHKPTSADAHSCLDTSQQTQIPAQLLIRADTRRNMQSLGYVHTHTRAYNQYMQMHTVTNSRRMQNNTCEIWESQHGWRLRGKHEWNTVISCAAHDYEPSMLTCRPSKHGPSLYHRTRQALHKARTHTSSHKEGTCAQTLKSYKDLQSVHESWNDSSKTQWDTSLKNILRSVYGLSLGPHIRAWSLGAYQFCAQKKCKQVGSYSVIVKKACLAAIAKLYPSQAKNASTMQITSAKKKTAEPKLRQPCFWNISSVCCLCSHQLNWLQLTLNQPRCRLCPSPCFEYANHIS